MKTVIQGACLFLCIMGPGSVDQAAEPLLRKPMPPMPSVASWYSVQRPTAPPLPFNPFPDLPVFALEPGRFAFDDRAINYVELQS